MSPSRLALQDAGSTWILPVAGQQVTRCCLDYAAVSLLTANGVCVYIEAPFVYAGLDAVEYTLDPDEDASHLAPFIRLRRQSIKSAEAFKDGSLEVRFGDGSRIQVPADQSFEPWNVSGPGGLDGLRIVSMPGGELAIWTDRR